MKGAGVHGYRRHALLALAAGIAFLLTAAAGDLLMRRAGGLGQMWPANAVLLGLLMALPRVRYDGLAIAAGGVVASLLFHLLLGEGPAAMVLHALADTSEAAVALVLLRRYGRVDRIFDRVSDVLALVLACAAASLLSATIAAVAHRVDAGTVGLGYWLTRYSSGLLNQLVLAPMIVVVAQLADRRRTRAIAARTVAELIFVLGLVAVVTGAVFLWSDLPILFSIIPAVLLATFRVRAFGAVGAIAIVALLAGVATAQGSGPIAHAIDDPGVQLLVLQAFLASCFLTALPIAAMLTERDSRAEEARLLADRFKVVVENIGEVIFRIDRDGCWAYLNPAWEALTGRPIATMLGRAWTGLIDQPERDEIVDRVAPILRGEGRACRRVARLDTAAGPRWVELFIQCLRDAEGNPLGATGTMRDIDDRKRLEEHVMNAKRRAEQRAREATLLAATDELTGLSNRRAFMAQLDREIAGAVEFGWPLALAMFDVDHFKRINDRYGHDTGDRVLQHIAARAGTVIRAGDMVGRLGGEEFAILMPGATIEDATIVAERLREAIEQSRDEDGLPSVTISIGLAEARVDTDARALLAAADVALYAAKGAGRNRVRIAA